MAAPTKKGKIKHQTATLNGKHNPNKALWRFGATAAEIHRDKPLKKLGASEETFHETNELFARSQNPHAPAISHQIAYHNHHKQENQRKDPLELEYTQNSQTIETINQSQLDVSRRSSYSYTYDRSNPAPKGIQYIH